MNKKYSIGIIVLLLVVVGVYVVSQKGGKTSPLQYNDLVMVTKPSSVNAVISSPYVVEGQARGYWFFEASFPIRLRDANGTEIAVGIAQAGSEWMTTEYVPFSTTLTFSKPSTKTGFIVLQKDNPSGLAENDDYFEIPVSFE